ncbi:DUF3710 domain-containing protein [Nocardioides sp.]|uniref:DUF3710 domain-containing protein n=1 Tax=Nocardioides sp. TaxID=35761 RepID=UPI003D132F89
MFRRKQAAEVEGSLGPTPEEMPGFDLSAGPWDVSEIDLEDGVERVDLGGLLVAPSPGRELRLQVDEATQTVQSVLIANDDGAIELRPFAAPRNGDLWSDIRPQIAEDMERRGGQVTEREGALGVELVGWVPVQVAEGQVAEQPSRIVGINGERWLLRATFLGEPATNPDDSADWEAVLGSVIVRRGSAAMPVGDPLPLVLPPQARRQA